MMLKFTYTAWLKSLPWRAGLAVILCANYSCSSNKGQLASDDPFRNSPAPQTAAMQGSSPDMTRGNHGLLENAGTPLQGSTQATPPAMSPQQYAVHPPQPGMTYGQQPAAVPAYPAVADGNEGRIRVKKEWPALPEGSMGVQAPQSRPSHEVMSASLDRNPAEWPRVDVDEAVAATHETQTPPASEVMPVSYEQTEQPTHKTAQPEFTPSEARVPMMDPAFNAPGHNPFRSPDGQFKNSQGQVVSNCPDGSCRLSACQDCDPAFYPDEYLCDGGDRKLPVHYTPGLREGLDTQDTITEYYDDEGNRHMKHTNEVCIYAPRFGAVKTVEGVSENLGVNKAIGAYETVNGLAMNTRIKPGTEQQTEQLNAARVRSRVSGLETKDITLGMNQATRLEDHTKLENTNTDYNFDGITEMNRWQTPASLAGIQAAAEWTRKQSPVIVAADVGGAELYSWFRPEEMVGLEDKSCPGELFIDKLADKGAAKPGDIITFTIRYKNVGDRELVNVQIIDNLTPRLEYIDGSATSELAGRLVLEDNGEGSVILKWEMTEPVKGHTAGEVTFQARVR